MTTRATRNHTPQPPELTALPLVHASAEVASWLTHYWTKLGLPSHEAGRLAVTDDRSEFHRWTGKRLNPLALGCYCYLPTHGTARASADRATLTAPAATRERAQPALPGFDVASDDLSGNYAAVPGGSDYRHLIFVEPGLLPLGVEVTVAHELIHLADRVKGAPRKHRCHGYDSISRDEATITGRDPEMLRVQLHEETERREQALRAARPYRYIYQCPRCHKEYPRVRRYARPVSCGRCDRQFNAAFLLQLKADLNGPKR
jgi:hypothetical protein